LQLKEAKKIHIKGLVQGVGFRPFVYRIAMTCKLHGWVENNNEGVKIHLEGETTKLKDFISSIEAEAPAASDISEINIIDTDIEGFDEFFIKKSENSSDDITDVSPDIAVCDDCLEDIKTQDQRISYPFINCTNCGPRFTIIKDLPYDRPMTSMADFPMCEKCQSEYKDILDRRFHAQPIACNHCGPVYTLEISGSSEKDITSILSKTAGLIDGGSIIGMKGLGGFHLACDAYNSTAVDLLRQKKNRDGKPFAVMFRDIETARANTLLSESEEKALTSWQRPIVLLKDSGKLAEGVSVGFYTVGGMLPYLPFHYLLFEQLKTDIIVLTSGNISDEPIIIDNNEAKRVLGPITDAILLNNRDIYNRTDDSVLRVINDKPRMIRRSRSWVPRPINLDLNVDGIVACGAELVNCFCIGKGHQAIMSQHIGDLKNAETLEFFIESVDRFKKLFRVEPDLIVHDLHPDYLSSRYAQESGLKTIAVQHHHAHIASCMAEYGLNEKVIGVSFDGVGLGSDNNIWGGEFMLCDLIDFERKTYFDYTPMPGGDMATKEPLRMALSYLYKTFGEEFKDMDLPFLKDIPEENINLLIQALKLRINTPLTSSAGRLFDAVAAMIGLCNVASFHAEAPMRLESIIDPREKDDYDFSIGESIDTSLIIKGICFDIEQQVSAGIMAAKFHNTVINIIFAGVEMIASESNIRRVVLSGGSFQNEYILERTENLLRDNGYEVFSPVEIPANDGGIALGQLAIAAARRQKNSEI
jgi:hydrogenase maturation protein HypF